MWVSMSDPVIEVFRLGVGILRWPHPDWSLAWMYASRPLDGHDLMFETLHRLSSQRLVRFMLCHIRDSSRRGMCMREVISNALSGRSAAIASSVVIASCPHHLASKFHQLHAISGHEYVILSCKQQYFLCGSRCLLCWRGYYPSV